jgi:hypothetical protein
VKRSMENHRREKFLAETFLIMAKCEEEHAESHERKEVFIKTFLAMAKRF